VTVVDARHEPLSIGMLPAKLFHGEDEHVDPE
jgi:hypothetical protein